MSEKKYQYTATFKQPQIVVGIKLVPTGGVITEREFKNLKKDTYGASLLENGLLIVSETTEAENAETIPDFDNTEKETE